MPASPWTGVWSGRLGDAGIIALDIRDRAPGEPPGVQVWWLVEELRFPAPTRLEGDTLFLAAPPELHPPAPALAFRLIAHDQIKLVAHGVLPAPLDPVFADLTLVRASGNNPWYDITNNYYKTSEWGKWHERGNLKPLPAEWPAPTAEATARLLSRNVHALHAALVQTTLTPEFLAEVWSWTQKPGLWGQQTDHIIEAIARNPNTPVEVLGKIWAIPQNPGLWIPVAANPHAKPEWRDTLVGRIVNGTQRVRILAARHPDGPAELYRELAKIPDAEIRGTLAETTRLPPTVYEEIAREADLNLLTLLARNESSPVALLERLAARPERSLKFALLRNKQFPPESRRRLVSELAATAGPKEMDELARDPDLPAELLPRYAEELLPATRAWVARNPHASQELLIRLAQDDSASAAEAAREALKSRYPAEYARLASGWPPLSALHQGTDLNSRFGRAAAKGDLPELRRLADYLRRRGEFDGMLSQNVHEVVRAHQTAVMDWFLENGYAKDRFALAVLAGQNASDARWLAYFRDHGALEGKLAAQALTVAVLSGKAENVSPLLALGIDPNALNNNGETALHLAVLHRRMDLAEILLKAGARPDVPGRQGRTALDNAVQLKFFPAIIAMDTAGKHAALVQAFTKEFPPAPKSRFLGHWTNDRDGFYTVNIRLEPNGTAQFSAPLLGSLAAWRETGPNEAVLYFFNAKGEPEHTAPCKLRLNPEGTQLTFEPPKGGEVQRMRRHPR
jgi:hypothetical protein